MLGNLYVIDELVELGLDFDEVLMFLDFLVLGVGFLVLAE
jgi:hypothetical protein